MCNAVQPPPPGQQYQLSTKLPCLHMLNMLTCRLQTWDATLYMKRFPHLWSWRRKPSVAGMDPWQPSEIIFNDKPLPHHIRFQGAHWLCSPEHMASAVRAEFGTDEGNIEPPQNVCYLPNVALRKVSPIIMQ